MAKENTNRQRLLSIMAVAVVFIFAAFLILSSEYNSTGHATADEQQYVSVNNEVDYSNEYYSPSSGKSVEYLSSQQTSGLGPEYSASYGNVISTPGIKNQRASVLLYNLFMSSATNQIAKDTRISITNTHPTQSVIVHLFFVADVGVSDFKTTLTAMQTYSFLTSDFAPGSTGYIIAIAENNQGMPINFNYLAGDEYFRDAINTNDKYFGGIDAIGFDAIAGTEGGVMPDLGNDLNMGRATLKFDGVNYAYPAGLCRIPNIPSRACNDRMIVVFNAFGGSLMTGTATIGSGDNALFGLLYDDAEQSQSFTIGGGYQKVGELTNTFPATVPRFDSVIPAGRSGWMEVWSKNSGVALYGAYIVYSQQEGTNFFGAELLDCIPMEGRTATLTVPVFPLTGN